MLTQLTHDIAAPLTAVAGCGPPGSFGLGYIYDARAAIHIKVGVLHSLSGTWHQRNHARYHLFLIR